MTDRTRRPGSARELLIRERLRRGENVMAGRDPQGVAPVPVQPSATWIITQVDPVLMCQPLTGGPAVSVESSAALKGAKPGMRVEVQTHGYGRRVAVALIDPLPISERDKDETVAVITTPKGGSQDVTVGGNVTIDAGDVGAMPDTVRAPDIGGAATNHNHTFSGSGSVSVDSASCVVRMPSPTLNWFDLDLSQPQSVINTNIKTLINRTRDAVAQMIGANAYCQGCGTGGTHTVSISGNTGGGSGGGGGYTPPVAGGQLVTINVNAPIWFDPGSPATFTTQWADDIRELTWRLYEASASLKGKTFPVSSGGTITISYPDSVNVAEVGGAGGFSSWWSETTNDNLGVLFSFWQWVANRSFPISTGGTVTVGGLEPAWNNPGIPGSFSQPYAAAVRLMLKRLFETANSICGRSF